MKSSTSVFFSDLGFRIHRADNLLSKLQRIFNLSLTIFYLKKKLSITIFYYELDVFVHSFTTIFNPIPNQLNNLCNFYVFSVLSCYMVTSS